MTSEEAQNLLSRINQEGFHYCFMHYSDFENIKDKKFHNLRLEYINTSKKLLEYIKNDFNKLDNN